MHAITIGIKKMHHWHVVRKFQYFQMMIKEINNFELIVQWIYADVNNKV